MPSANRLCPPNYTNISTMFGYKLPAMKTRTINGTQRYDTSATPSGGPVRAARPIDGKATTQVCASAAPRLSSEGFPPGRFKYAQGNRSPKDIYSVTEQPLRTGEFDDSYIDTLLSDSSLVYALTKFRAARSSNPYGRADLKADRNIIRKVLLAQGMEYIPRRSPSRTAIDECTARLGRISNVRVLEQESRDQLRCEPNGYTDGIFSTVRQDLGTVLQLALKRAQDSGPIPRYSACTDPKK